MLPVIQKEIIFFEDKKGKKPFIDWFRTLSEDTQDRIDKRFQRLSLGNYGDFKRLKVGINELRFKFGSGYRIYFGEHGDKIVVIIKGGNKKTQSKDIKQAILYWKEYTEKNYD